MFKIGKGGNMKSGSRKKSGGKPWYIRPGAFLYQKTPDKLSGILYASVLKYMRKNRSESEDQASKRCQSFLEEELAICFWGFIMILLLLLTLTCYCFFHEHDITVERPSFGQGEKKQEFILKDRKKKETVSLVIEEAGISDREREKLFQSFFQKLEKNMRGKNRSITHVNQDLRFDEELPGYPFEIDYEPEDLSLIGLGGKLGEKARRTGGQDTKETKVKVTASYKDYRQSRSYTIILVAPSGHKPDSVLKKAAKGLRLLEGNSREKKSVTFPGNIGGVTVDVPGSRSGIYGIILLTFIIPHAWVFRRFYRLRERELKWQKEVEEDFPVLVHLLTLYMKSGLSFASSIHRIVRNRTDSGKQKEKREIFEEIAFMDKQLMMGISQKEVCLDLARRSRNALYHKLSMALIQIFVKGSKEGDRILELMEKEAFAQRIDRARKEGKKAETKLILPMILLLCMVMVIVLFPAIVRFRGF